MLSKIRESIEITYPWYDNENRVLAYRDLISTGELAFVSCHSRGGFYPDIKTPHGTTRKKTQAIK